MLSEFCPDISSLADIAEAFLVFTFDVVTYKYVINYEYHLDTNV